MNDNIRWAALVARKPEADGTFVYCVKTTKIFCRPICKARLARRSNVEFFDTVAEAQAAGYRACKRCQPQLASYTPEADKIRKACRMLQSLPDNAPLPGLERMAKETGLTKHHFHRLFKRETGLTPRDYALACRSGHYSESTDSAGATPISPANQTETQAKPEEEKLDVPTLDDFPLETEAESISTEFVTVIIYYQVLETTHGCLLIAFQDRRVCKLELGSNDSELLQSLVSSFPTLYHLHSPVGLANSEDTIVFQDQIDAIVEALEHPSGKVLNISLSLSLQQSSEAMT